MHTNGFIPFYKEELNDWLFDDPIRFSWWLWLRARATYKACMQCVGQSRIEVQLNPGELAITKTRLRELWGVNKKTVDNFLSQMEREGRLAIRKENGALIICIRPDYVFANTKPTVWRVDEKSGAWVADVKSVQNDASEGLGQLPDEASVQEKPQVVAQLATQAATIIKNKEKEKNKKLTVDCITREQKFFDDLKMSDETLTQMASNLKPANGIDELRSLLENFLNHCLSTEDYHDSFPKFKKHFLNWARIVIKANQKQKSKASKNESNEKRSGISVAAAQRSGTDVNARTAADYANSIPSQLADIYSK